MPTVELPLTTTEVVKYESFEDTNFVISRCYPENGLYKVAMYIARTGADSITGVSDPFTFGDNAPVKAYCQQAYDRAIEAVNNLVKGIE